MDTLIATNSFKHVIDHLVEEIDALRGSIGPLMETMNVTGEVNNFFMSRFLEESGELVQESSNGEKNYKIGPSHFNQLRRIERQIKSTSLAAKLLPESLLVTLVSRFDAFLGRLIRTMLLTCPELLKSSERTLTLSSLIEIGDFESAKEFLIEKEIESVLRGSHEEHFAWIENKLGITLRKDLPSWPVFIEMTERRNLFVHNDGIVSHQYIAKCKDNPALHNPSAHGEKLAVAPDYYRAACDCLIEIAVKLTHVMWRKLLPSDRSAADDALTSTCYELLIHENYVLADKLLRFANETLKKHASERHRLIFLINWAQANKWMGHEKHCRELLDKEDWTAKGLDFQLCVAVLKEQYDVASSLMKQIGKDGAVSDAGYRDWPVFRKARKEQLFQEAYRTVFGEEMKLGEHLKITGAEVKVLIENLIRVKFPADTNTSSG